MLPVYIHNRVNIFNTKPFFMKFRFEIRYLILLFSLSFFFSCKKDDNPSPSAPEPTLFEKVQGKWIADIELPARISKPSGSGTLLQPSKKVQDIGYITSVEFFNDSSYILTFNYYSAFTDKFSIKDSSSFELKKFGTISDLKVAGDSISFNCSYYDIPLTVKAAKVSNITIDNNKKSILKYWTLTTEEDGATVYNNWGIETGEVNFFFSTAGTFLMKMTKDDDYVLAFSYGWNTFQQKENALRLIYGLYTETGSIYSYMKILELTESRLKMQIIVVSPEYDENENVTGEKEVVQNTFVLTAS